MTSNASALAMSTRYATWVVTALVVPAARLTVPIVNDDSFVMISCDQASNSYQLARWQYPR